MPKQNLYYVIKIPTSTIRRKRTKIGNEIIYDLGDYSYKEARENGELVAIGDNLVLHKLREYYGDTLSPLETYDLIQSLYEKRNALKKQKASKENSRKIQELQEQIDNILFVKDIVNVKVSNKNHYYDIARNGFIMNGIKYKRLCCGSGQMRRNTVTFVNEEIYDYLVESLMCGLHGKIDKISIAKFSAYFALAFSSVLWVSTPRICVVKDYSTIIPDQKIDYIVVDENGKKRVENRTMDIILNSADGQGLISPRFAQIFSNDMNLSYTACQFVVRSVFIKGCLLTFDFASYAKQVCGIDKIKSIYGEEFNIDDVDVILTESMFKMHKYYNSCKEYEEYHKKYNLKWGVSRYNKKYDDEYSLVNYQYIQNCNLSDKDIDDLIAPTIDWFRKICSGDPVYSTLFALGCQDNNREIEESIEDYGSIFAKAIAQNSLMLKDTFIQKKLYENIKESFRNAKIGRVWVKGSYQFMLSDPIPLIRNALGLDATGLIPANHVYSAYWLRQNTVPEEIDLCRSPMVDRHEHNVVRLADSVEMRHWYKYLYSGIIYSIYDTSTIRHSDSDFDGDIVFSTDNQQFIKGAYRDNCPITYEKVSAPEAELTYENIIRTDVNGFDTLVGQITNKSTSIIAMLPNFPPDKYPEEHAELLERLKLLREIIGSEIDKIKLGVSPEFPKEWVERVRINEDDSDIVKAEKYRHNSMVINKKPYFMIYIYDTLYKAYKKHIKQFDYDSMNMFGLKLRDLKYKKDKTHIEKAFLKRVEYFSPVLDTPCAMNILCHKIEAVENEIKFDNNSQSILPEFNKYKYKIDPVILEELYTIYKKYYSAKKFNYITSLVEEALTKYQLIEYVKNMRDCIIVTFSGMCRSLISNTEELFEYLIALSEMLNQKGEKFDFTFIWDMLNNDILDIIPKENQLICVETDGDDPEGVEYLGRKFKLVRGD